MSKKLPLKRIAKLLARYLRKREKNSEGYTKQETIFKTALELGAPIGEPIELPDGRKIIIQDKLDSETHTISAWKVVSRYKVEDYKEPRLKKGADAAAAAGFQPTESEASA